MMEIDTGNSQAMNEVSSLMLFFFQLGSIYDILKFWCQLH